MNELNKILQKELDLIKKNGLYKSERIIHSAQDSEIRINNNKKVLNFCANNYLGLSNHPDILNESINGIKKYGFGLSSVRFICGTQSIHEQLEKQISMIRKNDDSVSFQKLHD